MSDQQERIQNIAVNFNPDGSVNFTVQMGFVYFGFLLPKERMIEFLSAYKKQMQQQLQVDPIALEAVMKRGDLKA